MSKTILLLLLGLIAIGQFTRLGFRIHQKQTILEKGQAYPIHCRVYDPHDPFRGRYVAIQPSLSSFQLVGTLDEDKPHYISLRNDDDGKGAVIADISNQKPDTDFYLALPCFRSSGVMISPQLPYHRFYMNEKLAPAAEDALDEALQKSKQDCFMILRVYQGKGVIEDLIIGDKTIAEIAQQALEDLDKPNSP